MRASQTPNTKTCWQGYCANIEASSNLFSLLCDTYSELVCFPLDIQSKLISPFDVVEKDKGHHIFRTTGKFTTHPPNLGYMRAV